MCLLFFIMYLMKDIIEIAKECIVRVDNYSIVGSGVSETKELSNGTGFFIDSTHIMTNHHVIKGAKELFINIIGKEEPIEVEVLWYQPELDFAILRQIHQSHTPKHMFKIGCSKTLRINDKIEVIGFPLGGHYNNIKVYEGKINGWEQNKIQHDTNTNPGMSGSPLIRNNKIVGLHKEGHASETIPGNIMFAATIDSIKINKIINTSLPHGYVKIPRFPFITQNISKPMMDYFISEYSLSRKISGVMVNRGIGGLRYGDILCSINSYDLSNKGNIDYHHNGENIMHYDYLSQYMFGGDSIIVEYVRLNRDKKTYRKKKIELKMLGQKVKHTKVSKKKVSFIFGDIVVQNIDNDKLSMADDDDFNGVVISHIFPYSVIYMENIIDVGSIITHLNSKKVKSISDIKKVLQNSKEACSFVTIQTSDDKFTVMRKKDLISSVEDNAKWNISKSEKQFYKKQKKIWKL